MFIGKLTSNLGCVAHRATTASKAVASTTVTSLKNTHQVMSTAMLHKSSAQLNQAIPEPIAVTRKLTDYTSNKPVISPCTKTFNIAKKYFDDVEKRNSRAYHPLESKATELFFAKKISLCEESASDGFISAHASITFIESDEQSEATRTSFIWPINRDSATSLELLKALNLSEHTLSLYKNELAEIQKGAARTSSESKLQLNTDKTLKMLRSLNISEGTVSLYLQQLKEEQNKSN